MKILVTGGAGFIGSATANMLLKNGHSVTIVDNLSTGRKQNIPKRAKFYFCDCKRLSTHKELSLQNFDVIYHFAALTSVQDSVKRPLKVLNDNLKMTMEVIKFSKKCRASKIIFSSSAAVYDDVIGVSEEYVSPTYPTSIYGWSKLLCENFLENADITHVILRYFNVYGPGTKKGVIPSLIEMFKSKKPLVIVNDACGYTPTRDYIHLKDVVRANMIALKFPKSSIFNIGTGVPTNITDMCFMLFREPFDIKYIKYNEKQHGLWHSCADTKRAKYLLGFTSTISLEKGLEEMR